MISTIFYRRILVFIAVAALPLLGGCNGGGGSATRGSSGTTQQSFVYYSTDGPQVGIVAHPITSASTLAGVLANTITLSQQLAFDPSGRLYVLNNTLPFTVSVFTPPTTVASFVLALPSSVTTCVVGDAFDASGNLWITDPCTDKIFEFNGPFTASTTLSANIVLTSPSPIPPEDIAFDPAGNLYASLPQSGTTQSIEVWLKGSGFTTGQAVDHYLNGLTDTIGLAFDKFGNLYAGNYGHGIGEYFSSNLGANAVPNVLDNTGAPSGYNPWGMTTDSLGNLYVADCSFATAGIYVYSTGSGGLTPSLAPVMYTDSTIASTGCVAGIAIH